MFQMGLAEVSELQMESTEAFVDSVSQDWAEREVGLLPSPPFSFLSPDSDPKSIPPKDTCMHICIPGDPTCNNVPCLCTPRTLQGFQKEGKKLLLLNVCYWKIKDKRKKGTANLIVEGSFVYNCKMDKSIATEKYH